MLKEKVVDYLYDINARCDYALEDVADDIIDMMNEDIKQMREREKRWNNVIGF